ncbi:hypothetical protein BAUCODRAFT_134803 [Baudoinia panamericana UAMH 10762]|uniref:Zn(2)-C6 fungal-type domain-containing protein n=1 Tax=Baudoinia panamericana (strain UAMH 10762) TaxID=717646 RepID=M2MWX7_BAUPA|nr:uncharacterized protein BAUCODRAFT_134803 [Baudoinia panamericana UAMH 10762]EMC91129.1 hypothetical protein BAUCODRAFT_134803 [Baudoinia panamericana UAMH 10762]
MTPATDTDTGRKRRAHKKSRGGCANCKIRRVKCDEKHPECHKCQAYGVACNYGSDAPNELRHAGESAFAIQPAMPLPSEVPAIQDLPGRQLDFQLPPTPPTESILNLLNFPLALHETDEVYRLTEQDLDRLQRFQDRTVLTVGTAQTTHIYRDVILKLGCEHSFLTHIILALVLMHDRYLSADPWQPPMTEETFHHYHGTAIFNKVLSQPMPHEVKDAMWGCAALLGCLTLASVDASKPEESWPLKPDGLNDLDWLRMSDGKKEVWRIANPLREDSVWRPVMTHVHSNDATPVADRPELNHLIPAMTRLYSFDESANAEGDPYHTATSIILRLLPIQCTHGTIMYFLSFLGHMNPDYRLLLHQKDHRAMLLLAWWYAKMMDYPVWWLQRRATIECKAICIYLGRRYIPQSDVGRLLDFPKMMCGFAISGAFGQQVDEARSSARLRS